jgi:hypothetical protein
VFKRRVLIICFFLLSLSGVGQVSSDFVSLDKSTYDFYLKKDWDNLIRSGKIGLQQGYDYYYLRLRMGIAYYEKKNYRKAIVHFRKALGFNDNDELSLEYLYYAYLFSGRPLDASFLSENFSPSLRSRLNLKDNLKTKSFSVFNTYRFNPDYENLYRNFTPPLETNTNGWQLLEKNLDYLNFQFAHQFGKRITFYHGYGYLTKLRYLFLQEDLTSTSYTNDRFHQYQIFLSGNILVSNYFKIRLTTHYLNLRPKTYSMSIASPGPSGNQSVNIVTPENNWSGFFSGIFDAGLFAFDIGLGLSNFNKQTQFQQDFEIRFFPFGNLNLYSLSKLSHQFNYAQNDLINDRFIFNHSLGFRVFNHLWMELNGTLGELSNFQDFYGTIIYNDVNPINYKIGVTFVMPFPDKGFDLTILYNYMEAESLFFSSAGFIGDNNNSIKHDVHSITGGIKWNFSRK